MVVPSGIPVVDLSPILGQYGNISQEAYEKVAKELGDAMSGIGFAYLINHGVSRGKVDKVYEKSQQFFKLPISSKIKFKKLNPPENFHGYTRPGDELLNEAEHNSTELREVWDVWGIWEGDRVPYPNDSIPGFKDAFDNLRPELDNVSKKLFVCLAKYLNLEDEEFFVKRHRNLGDPSIQCQTQMRSMYYYKLNSTDPIPPNAIRCGEHSDWGSITLLFQDHVGGLEVRSVHGEWVEATPLKDAIILNSGQLMEHWTGGRFHAALHRVRIPEGNLAQAQTPRQSFIYFVNPDGHERVEPIVTPKKGHEHVLGKAPIVAFDHYKQRIVEATTKGY